MDNKKRNLLERAGFGASALDSLEERDEALLTVEIDDKLISETIGRVLDEIRFEDPKSINGA